MHKCSSQDTIQYTFLSKNFKNEKILEYFNTKLIEENNNQINKNVFLNLKKLIEIKNNIKINTILEGSIYEISIGKKKISTVYVY